MEKNKKVFSNPILPGFYPDPSICRVGEDYYLVTSSFTYYPGIPIFHSKDLVNWEQIGHVLDRPSQLDLVGLEQSDGIFAPTLRYHDEKFYLITTNVRGGGNFFVTTNDPAGDWSDPIWLKEAPGIDPSLFFDNDGRVYYTGSRPNSAGPEYDGDREIWLQELDLVTGQLIGEKQTLWTGALSNVIWAEAPHLYKKDGYYYLLIAEGGTGYHHAVTIARSKNIDGPYTGNPANPILTHRHLGRDHPIVNVGHGDLVKTQNDEWWMVVLASRPYGGYYRNLGRETFLVPVSWEDGWPLVSPGSGQVEKSYPVPDLPITSYQTTVACDNFETKELTDKWNFLRTPQEKFYTLDERPGYLRLFLRPEKMTSLTTPSFVGRRQQHKSFLARTVMEFTPQQPGETAGLVLLQNNEYHYRFVRSKEDGQSVIQLIKCKAGEETVLAKEPYELEQIYLYVEAQKQSLNFYYGEQEDKLKLLLANADGRILSTDVAGGFLGAYLGLYASSNGQPSKNQADFDWFEYKEL